MAQSLANIHIHLVYSTKNRQKLITDSVRDSLHPYNAAVLKAHGCHPVLINSVEDHIHLLFDLGRKVAVYKIVAEMKASSSRWIKTQGVEFARFEWQGGYGAFAVDFTNIEPVRKYIAGQREHHRSETFQDEFRRFLAANEIAFDEKYVWD